ncbi:rhodanese-like domain-containing protein [uncultured Ferrimonas sp.]|uniref:rhodanese-like domain-containing protein n=1 Tax=uncultured Ferrimonas sp. TaxID=432640 RepID=UPI00260481A1|nr:rhodanese-like domain-containing protein [uncultured Ferrimonas sp.]
MKKWLIALITVVLWLPAAASERAELAWQQLQQGATLIDVRTSAEFAAKHLEGAHNLPFDQIGATIASLKLDQAKPIVVYCRSGRRSGIAEQTLAQQGYLVYNGGGLAEMLASKPD